VAVNRLATWVRARLAWLRFAAWVGAVGTAALLFRNDQDQDTERCQARNDSIRVAALTVAGWLVDQSPDAPPARVEAALADLNERLDAADLDCT